MAPGGRALWVRDEYLAGKADTPGTYTLNDVNSSEPLRPDDDLDTLIDEWKEAVEWEEDDD